MNSKLEQVNQNWQEIKDLINKDPVLTNWQKKSCLLLAEKWHKEASFVARDYDSYAQQLVKYQGKNIQLCERFQGVLRDLEPKLEEFYEDYQKLKQEITNMNTINEKLNTIEEKIDNLSNNGVSGKAPSGKSHQTILEEFADNYSEIPELMELLKKDKNYQIVTKWEKVKNAEDKLYQIMPYQLDSGNWVVYYLSEKNIYLYTVLDNKTVDYLKGKSNPINSRITAKGFNEPSSFFNNHADLGTDADFKGDKTTPYLNDTQESNEVTFLWSLALTVAIMKKHSNTNWGSWSNGILRSTNEKGLISEIRKWYYEHRN